MNDALHGMPVMLLRNIVFELMGWVWGSAIEFPAAVAASVEAGKLHWQAIPL